MLRRRRRLPPRQPEIDFQFPLVDFSEYFEVLSLTSGISTIFNRLKAVGAFLLEVRGNVQMGDVGHHR